MLAIYIDAGNNSNGNPRRGWIIADDAGNFVDFVNEGYEGHSALANSGYGNVTPTSKLEVKPSVYRDAYQQGYTPVENVRGHENKLLRESRSRRR
jgi:hypothetical protein